MNRFASMQATGPLCWTFLAQYGVLAAVHFHLAAASHINHV